MFELGDLDYDLGEAGYPYMYGELAYVAEDLAKNVEIHLKDKKLADYWEIKMLQQAKRLIALIEEQNERK